MMCIEDNVWYHTEDKTLLMEFTYFSYLMNLEPPETERFILLCPVYPTLNGHKINRQLLAVSKIDFIILIIFSMTL